MRALAQSEVAAAYLELGSTLMLLAITARLARRLELSPIPFYLLGGLALGAVGSPQITAGFVETTASVGVVLLLFVLGLEYTAEELRANLRVHAPAGLVDAVLNFTPGFAAGLLLGFGPAAAVALGGVTWVSSSGIVAKALDDLGRVVAPETPVVLSILVAEDLAMIVYLPLLGSLLVGGGVLAAFGSLLVAAAAAVLALVIALRHGPRVERLVGHPSEEVWLLSALGLVLLVAGLAERLQVSAAVGAFLLGIALSGEVAQQTQRLLAPFRDFAAALFFLFFGLSIEPGSLGGMLLPAAALAFVTALTKLATGWWAAARVGLETESRARSGAALVARGEFSIVIAGIAASDGVDADLRTLAVGYVLLLALAGPILMRYAGVLARPAAPTTADRRPRLLDRR